MPATSIDRLILRAAGLSTLVVGVVALVIGGVLSGAKGALGAGIATVLVLAFFSVGQAVLGRVLRNNPEMALTVALAIYLVKIGLLLIVILLFADTTAFDTKVFAATVVACTLAWTVAEVWIFGRTKVLVVEPRQSS